MSKNKCVFSDAWLNDSRFLEWLKSTYSEWAAYCVYCLKGFDIYSMGLASLLSHASGKNHSEIQMQRSRNTGTVFFGNSSTGEVHETNKKGNLARKENKVQKTLDSVTVQNKCPASGSSMDFKSYIKLLLSQIFSRIERTF